MTIEEIKASDKLTLTAADVGPVLGSDPAVIRIQARIDPDALGFPVSVIGNRVKIPRLPFLEFLGEK